MKKFMPTNKPSLANMKVMSLLAAICLSLAACGGGGSSNTAAAPGTGGTGSYTIGPISGFGSIIINGVRYDDSSASVQTEDGDSSDDDKGSLAPDDLKLGMISVVAGENYQASSNGGLATSNATKIYLSNELRGPMVYPTTSATSFSLLQQTIEVNAGTVFANVANLAAATSGNCAYVEVYAFYNTNNHSYTATRVECKTTQPTDYRIFGPASSVVSNSFAINGLTISTTNLASSDKSAVTEGSSVRVRLSTTLSGNQSTASRLRVGTPVATTTARTFSGESELEGLIETYTSNAEFTVNGVSVVTNSSTVFESLALRKGLRVEVNGTLSNGVLTAKKVSIEDDSELNTEIEAVGAVSNLSNSGGTTSFTLTTSSQRVFTVTYVGTVARIANTKHVEVHGDLATNSNTAIVAKTVEVHD